MIIVLIVCAIVLFALVNYNSLIQTYHILNYVEYVSVILVILALYIYFAVLEDDEIADRKVRWIKAAKSYGGRNAMPMWNRIIGTLHTEAFGPADKRLDLILYSYIDQNDGLRHAWTLDSKARIISQYNPHINRLAFSDWRRMVMENALNVVGKKSLDDAIKIVEAHGYKIERKQKIRTTTTQQ